MQKILRFFLTSDRRRRCLLVNRILWLLRVLRDVEMDAALQYSDKLDCLDYDAGGDSQREYLAVEGDYIICDYAANILVSVIEDIESSY